MGIGMPCTSIRLTSTWVRIRLTTTQRGPDALHESHGRRGRGRSAAARVGQVGANGSLGVGSGQAAPKHAADAYAVANQAKLKMGTLLLELYGEPVPAGYDGKNAGMVPGSM